MSAEALAIASPILATLALLIAIMSWVDGKHVSRLTQHYDLVTVADRMLGEDGQLLRFHGIDPSTIEAEYGVSPAELAYLLQSFNAGSISYKIAHGERERVRPFTEGSYWYNILSNDPTQRAFPLVQRLFDSKNPYMAACAETIRVVNANKDCG